MRGICTGHRVGERGWDRRESELKVKAPKFKGVKRKWRERLGSVGFSGENDGNKRSGKSEIEANEMGSFAFDNLSAGVL